MDLKDAWTAPENDDGEAATFTDALGKEVSVRMAQMPPPSLTERGSTTSNAHRVELYTGTQARARKDGDAMESLFDADATDRPDRFINDHAHSRISSVVGRNHQGGQVAPVHENFEPRSENLYDGLNPIKVTRQVRRHSDTNRAVQEWTRFGNERRGDDKPAIQGHAPEPRKAGTYLSEETGTQARRAAWTEAPREQPRAHLAREAVYDNRGSSDQARLHDGGVMPALRTQPGAALRTDGTQLPTRRLHTAAVPLTKRTAGVTTGDWDDVQQRQGARAESAFAVGALQGDRPLGDADSKRTARPVQRTNFHESALAALHDVSASDSTKARGGVVRAGFEVAAMHAALKQPLRDDARRGPTLAHEQRFSERPLERERARDSHADSTRVNRIVVDALYPACAPRADRSRSAPDDAVHSLSDAFGRAQVSESIPAVPGAPLLSAGHETPAADPRRVGNSVFAALAGAVARALRNPDVKPATGLHQSQVPLYVRAPVGERRLADDTLSQRRKPSAGGAVVGALDPMLSARRREQIPTTTRPESMLGARTVVAPPERRGHRE